MIPSRRDVFDTGLRQVKNSLFSYKRPRIFIISRAKSGSQESKLNHASVSSVNAGLPFIRLQLQRNAYLRSSERACGGERG